MNKSQNNLDPYWLLKATRDYEQEFLIVIAATGLLQADIDTVKLCLSNKNTVAHSTKIITNKFVELSIKNTSQQAWTLFKEILIQTEDEEFDVAVIPANSRIKKLLVCDMDSTIVANETLDEFAAHAGIGEQVSQITARAMRGKLDFRQALDERVSLLKGLSESIFEEILEKIELNPGAEILLRQSKKNNIRTVLVSGGFEPIVKVIAEKLGFDRYVCNSMQLENNQLMGKVLEPIVDSSRKLNVLIEECQSLMIKPEEACCIGDGANDLLMLQAAGLGISFQGKPLLRTSLAYQINSSDLDFVLLMMGITE